MRIPVEGTRLFIEVFGQKRDAALEGGLDPSKFFRRKLREDRKYQRRIAGPAAHVAVGLGMPAAILGLLLEKPIQPALDRLWDPESRWFSSEGFETRSQNARCDSREHGPTRNEIEGTVHGVSPGETSRKP